MRRGRGSWARQAATRPRARRLQPPERCRRRCPLPDPSLPGPDRLDHLDLLALDFHGLLPEVHANGGLSLVREGPPAEAEGQAGLAHVGVPNHDDFEDANLHVLVQRRVELQGRQASGRGGLQAPVAQDGLRHLPRTGPGPQPPSRAPHKENGHVSALEASELCACVCVRVCECMSARVCVRRQRVRARVKGVPSLPRPPSSASAPSLQLRGTNTKAGERERDGGEWAGREPLPSACALGWDARAGGPTELPKRPPRPPAQRPPRLCLDPPLPGPQGHTGGGSLRREGRG